MVRLARIIHKIRSYPHWARRSNVVMLVALLTWIALTYKRPLTVTDVVVTSSLFLAAFLDHCGRPFWFLWGIVVGAVLIGVFGQGHLFLDR